MVFIRRLGKIAFLLLLTSAIFGFQMNNTNRSPSKPYVGYSNEVINDFIKEVYKEFGFKCIVTGGSMPNDVQSIRIGFIAYRKATVEIARELEVTLIEKFLKTINMHEKIRPYLREYPFRGNRADISISFCNKKNESETENSISSILQARNKLFYDVRDLKTGSLITIFEEPYEDALKIVQDKRSNESTTF